MFLQASALQALLMTSLSHIGAPQAEIFYTTSASHPASQLIAYYLREPLGAKLRTLSHTTSASLSGKALQEQMMLGIPAGIPAGIPKFFTGKPRTKIALFLVMKLDESMVFIAWDPRSQNGNPRLPLHRPKRQLRTP